MAKIVRNLLLNSYEDYLTVASSFEELYYMLDNVSEDMPAGPIKYDYFRSYDASLNLADFTGKRGMLSRVFGVVDNLPMRFSPGGGAEKKIAEDGVASYLYARDVLKGPFPLGEEAISRVDASTALKGPFPLGVSYALDYAVNILKNRFVLAEPEIFHPYYRRQSLREFRPDQLYIDFLKSIGMDSAELDALAVKYVGHLGPLMYRLGVGGKELFNLFDIQKLS